MFEDSTDLTSVMCRASGEDGDSSDVRLLVTADPDATPMGYGAIAVESAAGASGETDLESAPADTVSVDRYTLIDLG